MNLKKYQKHFYESSGYIRRWLDKQPAVKEESLTDWLLFDISDRISNIFYRVFTRHEEGRTTGADWEWWILFPKYYFRFRVQAKKISLNKNNYDKIARKNEHGRQIDSLLKDSKKANAILLYALYSPISNGVRCGESDITQNDGVFIASANKIHDFFIKNDKIMSKDLLQISNPFSCFTCCPLIAKDEGGLKNFLNHYFESDFMSETSDDDFRGIHTALPEYLLSFLKKARDGADDGWENDFESQLEDFNALLVYDFRNSE